MGSGHPAELGDATHLNPFDHEDIAVVIVVGAVRGDEFAGSKSLTRFRAKVLVVPTIAQMHYELIVRVQDGNL